MAQAADFVRRMRGGLEARIDQGGINVSGRTAPAAGDRPGPGAQAGHLPLRRLLLGPGPGDRRPAARRPQALHRQQRRAHRRPAGLDDHLRGPASWSSRTARWSGIGSRRRAAPSPARPTPRSSSRRSSQGPDEVGRDRRSTENRRPTRTRRTRRTSRSAHGRRAPAVALESVGGPHRTLRRTFGRCSGAWSDCSERKGRSWCWWPSCPSPASSLNVFGPRVLGHATDIIVSGSLGHGIDFAGCTPSSWRRSPSTPARPSSRSVSAYTLAGVVQRLMQRLRRAVEDKIHALPLSYIDQGVAGRPAQPGHQRHRQHRPEPPADPEPDAQLAAARDRRGHHDVHHLAAAGRRGPDHRAGVGVRHAHDRRPGPAPLHLPVAQPPGRSTRIVEEAFTGHAIVKSFGRQRRGRGRFRATNDELFESSFGAQFMSSAHAAGDHVSRQHPVRAGGRGRRAAGGQRGHQHRRHPGLHPVLPHLLHAAHPAGVADEHLPERDGVAGTGLRGPRRRGAEPRPRGPPVAGRHAGGWPSKTVTFSYDPRRHR